jgi:hypothetical protein
MKPKNFRVFLTACKEKPYKNPYATPVLTEKSSEAARSFDWHILCVILQQRKASYINNRKVGPAESTMAGWVEMRFANCQKRKESALCKEQRAN